MIPLNEREKERLAFAKQSIDIKCDNIISAWSKIHSTALIGLDGFGFARDERAELVKVNHGGNVIIHPFVVIRAYCTIDRAVKGSTEIGSGTKIDHGCHVAHGVVIGEWNTFAAHCIIEGSCVIGSYNTFGTGVIVQKKIKVGSNCIIGSGSVITKDVADNSIMVGNPARLLRMR